MITLLKNFIMDAMTYEYLIRRVNGCGRDGSIGADTCFYNDMEMAESNLQTKTLYKTDDERQYQYAKAFATVRMYVRKALEKGLDKIKYRASEKEKKQLEEWTSLLNHRMNDRQKLDEIIQKASDTFIKHGLEA